MNERVKFRVYSLCDFYNRSLAETVLKTIMTAAPSLKPVGYERFDTLQPVSSENALEVLTAAWMNDQACRDGNQPEIGILSMEGASPAKASYLISWDRRPKESFNLISISVAASAVSKPSGLDAFLNLARTIVELVDGVWGEVTWSVPRTSNASTLFDLRQRMPQPGWMLILGEPYVGLFGTERILTTPCHKIERLSSGHYLIQMTGRTSQLPDASQVEAVCNHLGKDAFLEPGKSVRAYRSGLAPMFDFKKR